MKLICFVAFFPFFAFAQAQLDKEIFLDSLKFETLGSNFIYSRIIKNYHTIQNEYLVTDYYKSGQQEMSGKTTDRDDLVKKGIFTYFFENGSRHELVNYQNSIRLGAYFLWDENGKQKIVGEYLKNLQKDDTEGILKVNQYWNNDGIQEVIDGNGFYEDVEDQYISSRGRIKEGLKDSIWTGSDSRLQTKFIEEYQKGILVFGTSIDSKGIEYNYKELIEEARPNGSAYEFRTNFLRNLKYTHETKFFGKSLVLSFFIEKDGYLRDVKTHLSISPEIDSKAVALLRGSAKWRPGASRGIKTRKRYFFPINTPKFLQKT
jgi:hypothetical protein